MDGARRPVPIPQTAAAPWYAPPVLAVLAAQLLTALADNALLIVAIALLDARGAPAWLTPALRVGFYASYVLLAPGAGRWADACDKGRLMSAVNAIKLAGALALLLGGHPLLVFAAIGCAAAAYAPARYGVLPQLCAGRQLVRANAAMEVVTIVAIIGGYGLGSALVARVASPAACALLAGLYGLAALCTVARRHRGVPAPAAPLSFRAGARLLLADGAARQSLAMTSIFWSAAAVLQFAMIDWARHHLGLALAQAALLPALFAAGMVAGAVLAGAWPLPAGRWPPLLCGVALGGAIMLMPLADTVPIAGALLVVSGVLAGVLLVPMNATLQARGAALMAPGLSVAVQNFFENGWSILFLAAYGIALAAGAPVDAILGGLGVAVVLLVALAMMLTSAAGMLARPRPPAVQTPLKEPRC